MKIVQKAEDVYTCVDEILIRNSGVIDIMNGWSNDRCQSLEFSKHTLYA